MYLVVNVTQNYVGLLKALSIQPISVAVDAMVVHTLGFPF
jgi:hypothetical protein